MSDAADAPPSSELSFLDPRRWRPYFAEVEREVWVICIVAAVGVTLQELVFSPRLAVHAFRQIDPEWAHRVYDVEKPPWSNLLRFLWWSSGTTASWLLLPWLAGRVLCGRTPRDYGIKATPWPKLAPYGVLFGFMVPVVFIAAMWLPGFSTKYPFYGASNEGWAWRFLLPFELAYGLQFFATESFFRGFMVIGLGRALGYRAILVTMIPYVMIHFHKPILEALAAIIAGIILGAFALRTRSIWGGLLVHLGVAWGMDFASMAVGGRGFPPGW